MSNGQSKVLTLVFTDLADSTALKAEHGDAAVGDWIERHRDHVTQLATQNRGRVIDWAGDGCFLTFDTSSAAVTFALRLQQIHHYESDLPGVRVGIHVGEVTEKAHNGEVRVEGLAVDVSARIGSLARPGQVLVSSAIQQSAKQRLGIHEFGQPIRWEAYGPYTLKGFEEPVDIREAGLESVSTFEAPSATEKAWPAGRAPHSKETQHAELKPIRKLAVLPLANLSGDAQQEYFVDAMTDAIITELAKIKALRVISRTSVMRYKNTTVPLPQIARELNVDGLIEGSVLRAGSDVRVTAQFIRGDSDEHLWAEYYDGTIDNILKLQKEIALAIADEIQVAVTVDERQELRSAKRIDPEAYDRFIKASRFGGDWTPASISRSLKEADEVIRLVPDFSRTYTLKATAHYFSGMFGYAPSMESFTLSQRAARKALRLDENDYGAQTVLGWIALAFEWDWDEAWYRLQRARAINSTNYFVYAGLGFLNVIAGRPTQAIETAALAVEIDPKNAPSHHNVGLMKFYARDYSGALAGLREALNQSDKVLPPYVDGILVAICNEDFDTARRFAKAAIDLGGPQPHYLAHKGYGHARAGEFAEAEAILEQLEIYSGPAQVLHWDLALLLLGLGRNDMALDALERAHRDREYLVALIGASPVWDPIRDEPRFKRLVQKLDYPDPLSWNP